jgi:lipopolysaccharide transport system ATP-binding protein
MSDDVRVRVENQSKRFCCSLKRSLWYGLQDLGSEIGGRRHGGGGGLPQSSADVDLRKDEFWAVKDVSFELRRGECLGLIGRNGAGKTTLLRMLNGLIKPDTGRIEMKGRIGALIALGAGFNPVLTGRENVYVNASILGLSESEVNKRIDDIIDFSGISDFIDSPVQSYSSGMQVRLGFATASMVEPDVLLLDEVLAVGDDAFHAKCWNRIGELRKNGTAFILVSHQMNNIIRLCTHVAYLKKGERVGGVEKFNSIEAYQSDTVSASRKDHSDKKRIPLGSGILKISSVVIDPKDAGCRPFTGHNIKIDLDNTTSKPLKYILEFSIRDQDGIITQFTNESYSINLLSTPGSSSLSIRIPLLHLNGHKAIVSITVWSENRLELYDWIKDCYIESRINPRINGRCDLPVQWILLK